MVYDVEICTARAIASEATGIKCAQGVPLPEGFCFLVSRSDGTIVQPAFEFFADAHLTIGPKPKLACSKKQPQLSRLTSPTSITFLTQEKARFRRR
jgi:hypothetical protein